MTPPHAERCLLNSAQGGRAGGFFCRPTRCKSRCDRELAETATGSTASVHEVTGRPRIGFLRFYEPNLQRWASRDPINEPGFNLVVRSPNTFTWDEEKNLYGFVHNDPMNLVDADGRVPVVAIFFYGNAIGNIGIACYSCKKLNDCLESAKDYTKRAGERMDPEKFQDWLRAAKPGSECTGLAKDCGVRVISATFWVAGRLLILRYLAK